MESLWPPPISPFLQPTPGTSGHNFMRRSYERTRVKMSQPAPIPMIGRAGSGSGSEKAMEPRQPGLSRPQLQFCYPPRLTSSTPPYPGNELIARPCFTFITSWIINILRFSRFVPPIFISSAGFSSPEPQRHCSSTSPIVISRSSTFVKQTSY
ncbi:uncharacterized protein BDV17DRAFT_205130 [Aspergillus undulatus]|uniref:uncharacterized protein n=1 Tax=Aspergillus undulatus TaxID=1810928 RepID=UPI003CCDBE75